MASIVAGWSDLALFKVATYNNNKLHFDSYICKSDQTETTVSNVPHFNILIYPLTTLHTLLKETQSKVHGKSCPKQSTIKFHPKALHGYMRDTLGLNPS